jgi:ATP-binding cassette subfamily B protein IrtB
MRSLWHIQSELPSAAKWRHGIALGFGEAICQAIPVGAIVIVTDRLRDNSLATTDAWASAVVCVLALVGQSVFRRLSYDSAWLAGTALSAELRLRVLDHLRRLPMSYHRRQPAGDTAAALTQDMFHIDMFVLEAVPRVAGNVALCVLVLGLLLVVDPPLALCVAVSLLAAVPVLRHNQRTLARLSTERQQLAADATARVVEYVQGIAVVRAFNQTGPVQQRLRSTLDDYRAVNARMAIKTSPLFGAFEATIGLGVPLVVAASSYWLFAGRIDAGAALVFLVVVLRVYEPIIQINDVSERLRLADASLDRIAALLDAPGQLEPAVLSTPQGFAVEFDAVGFSYEPGVQALTDVSFVAPERSMTAIVGPSGAGKTTLLNVVARFYDAGEGTVRIGGVDVRDLSSEQLFDAVSVVFQDVYLFNATIFDNIAFGRRDASVDDVIAAARAACCHDFIAALPEGYDTLVGEGGQTVSGGERQRISIARAILKDAPIVLLDEATAALDPINERLIARALAALSNDKTLLVIAHRLSTIRTADQIIVLEGGMIVQHGTHDALIAEPGLYARFWDEREKAAGWRLSPQLPAATG